MGHKQVGDMAAGSPVRCPALWTASAHGRTERVLQLLVGGNDIEERGGFAFSTHLSAHLANTIAVQASNGVSSLALCPAIHSLPSRIEANPKA